MAMRSKFGSLASNAVVCAAAILLDWGTPVEIETYIVYVLAAVFISWRSGRHAAAVAVVVFAVSIALEAFRRDYGYTAGYIPFVNLANKIAALGILVWFVSFARENYDEAMQAARTDALTRLANRRAFVERLEVALGRLDAEANPIALAYVDLDGFKAINDTLGHGVGDAVLIATAGTLIARLRPGDFAARLGGDEFVVLFTDTDIETARDRLTDVHAALRDVMAAKGWPVTFSIGLTQASPTDTIEGLVEHADRTMFAAKTSGKDRVVTRGREQASA